MLEHDGRPLDPFPFAERNDRAERLASCGVEGIARLDDGALALAWSTNATRGSRVTDLRLAVWNANGSLRWFADLDRSREAANWVANFRHSFITPFGDHLCAGTLWEGDTQVMCLEVKNGQATWKGSLPFWSGIDPQPGDNGLIVADLSAITQRYPFSGAEMRHQKLEGLGGRAGYYSSDGKRLYFAPSRVDAPPLIAYDLATFEEQWRTPLPAAPTSTLAEAFARFHRLLVQVDEQLFALDTESGAIAWAYDIGADVPTIAADDASIYVLARRADLPNRLVALDPATGKRRWSANMPSGTLRVDVVDGVLLVGSIRAVQRVLVPAEAAPDAD